MLKAIDFIYKKAMAWLKNQAKRAFMKKLGVALGGIKGYLVALLFTTLWKKFITPLGLKLKRMAKGAFSRKQNKQKVDNLENSETESDIRDNFNQLP